MIFRLCFLWERVGWVVAIFLLASDTLRAQTDSASVVLRHAASKSDWTGVYDPSFTRIPDTTNISPTKLVVAGAVIGGSLATIHFYQQKAWWLGERSQFWFKSDSKLAMNFDKLGHIYGTYVLSRCFGGMLSWSGVQSKQSTLYGSTLALGYQLLLEAEDGQRKWYGFDPLDAFANFTGALIPIMQETFPVLKNFSLKYSYYPSDFYIEELRSGLSNRIFLDDYDGMTLWLGMDPHFLMSDELARAVPAWLGVSFGYALRDLSYRGDGNRIFYLTLDYNLSKIETESSLLHTLFTLIDFIHLPAPGLRFGQGRVSLGVFYR